MKKISTLLFRTIARSGKQALRVPTMRFMSSMEIDKEGSDPDFQPKVAPGSPKGKIEIAFHPDATKETVIDGVEKAVKSNKILLMMKGTPQLPACGYSRMVVEVLKYYKVDDYAFLNVLKSEVVRLHAKEYADWPTYPQLFVNAELIGGCDIVMEMHKEGLLEKELGLK